jgi:predicted acylesterase/phospholipase RssA
MRNSKWILTLLMTLAACGPGYVNTSLNSLSAPGPLPLVNSNSRTESFVLAMPMVITNERTRQAPDTPSTDNSTARARTGTTGPAVLDADGCFVGLAISGGGLRSANFAAGCMFQLQQLGMLQKVDCISAVSGGTLVATYYCTAPDDQWNRTTVQKVLTHGYSSDIVGDFFLPWNFWNLALGNLTRCDLLAARFDDSLFVRRGHRLTFGDLRPDRPRLLLNATQLETGRRFTFDNSSFDELNSDLTKFPLSYAITASSAVPIAMAPVSLRDYSTNFTQYYHFVDGGVADNLGVQTLVESYEAQIQKDVNPYPHGAIIIVIDAGVQYNDSLTAKPVLGGLQSAITGLDLTSSVLLNRASSATMAELVVLHSQGSYTAEQLRAFIDELNTHHYVEIKDSKGNPVRVISLSLAQMAELSGPQFSSSVNAIGTNFDIEKHEAYELYEAAQILFTQRFDAKVKPLVDDLNSETSAGP